MKRHGLTAKDFNEVDIIGVPYVTDSSASSPSINWELEEFFDDLYHQQEKEEAQTQKVACGPPQQQEWSRSLGEILPIMIEHEPNTSEEDKEEIDDAVHESVDRFHVSEQMPCPCEGCCARG